MAKKTKQMVEERRTPKQEFSIEEKVFLGDTAYRWIGIGLVSYDNVELTKELRAELEERGLKITREGRYTTVFCKKPR